MWCSGSRGGTRAAPSMTTHVSAVTDGTTRVFTWEEGARIEAITAGLKTLAGQLLTLAQDGTPDGAHFYLEENNGLEEGSARPVLMGLVCFDPQQNRLRPLKLRTRFRLSLRLIRRRSQPFRRDRSR
ncbi:Imm32 family immunity protein [Streptomyces prasinus]